MSPTAPVTLPRLSGIALLAGLLAGGCAAEPQSLVYGTWAMSWDRGGTGWTPRYWYGTLVLRPDGADLAWLTSSESDVAKWELRSYEVDGDHATLEYGWRDFPDRTEFALSVDASEDWLVGTQAASGDWSQSAIPPVPVNGKRVGAVAGK